MGGSLKSPRCVRRPCCLMKLKNHCRSWHLRGFYPNLCGSTMGVSQERPGPITLHLFLSRRSKHTVVAYKDAIYVFGGDNG